MANKHTFTFPPESHANRVWNGKKQPYPVWRQHIPYPEWLQFRSKVKKPKTLAPSKDVVLVGSGAEAGRAAEAVKASRRKPLSLALMMSAIFGGRR